MLKLRQRILQVWSGKEDNRFLPILLSGFSQVYSIGLYFRNLCFEKRIFKIRQLGCKVVSIGNITVGGTGKTPMAITVAKTLKENGFRPAVLSRGYGGGNTGSIKIVSDGKTIYESPDEVGDEPCLMAGILRDTPILAGTDRYAAGKLAMEKMGVNVLVLDDGFQHRSLHRDINIALLDAKRPFGNGFLIPRGPLRERPAALERADLIIITRSDSVSAASETMLHRQFPAKKVMRAHHEPECIIDDSVGVMHPASFIGGKKIAAFCGIALPESFRNSIENLGGEIVFFEEFPDHHRYTSEDINHLMRKSREKSPDLILTTDKDRIKLRKVDFPGLFTLRIRMKVDNPEFSVWLAAGLSGHTA